MEIGVKVPGNIRLNESACDHGRHGRAFNEPGAGLHSKPQDLISREKNGKQFANQI